MRIFSLIALGVIIVSPSLAQTQPCTCGLYLGTFCASKSKDGSQFLSGECEKDAVYTCSEGGGQAQLKYYCTGCKEGIQEGQDGCGLG
jgi:hypothetical protein